MKLIQPRNKDIVIYNSLPIIGGLIGGLPAYIYCLFAVFISYTIYAWMHDMQETPKKGKVQNFIWAGFFIVNMLTYGTNGLSISIQALMYFYMLFFLILPMTKKAKEIRTNSLKEKGENHE